MVNRVAGLTEIAKKRGVDTDSLKAGDFVVFMNASWTQMALLTGSPGAGVLPTVTYVKSPRGKIHPGVIRELTRIFNGSPLSYDKALEPVLKKFMLDRKIKKTGDARG